MKNNFQQYISHLFIQPYDGTQGRLANQLIYSQLKNRLVMMTQKPSSMLAKWKYAGVLPLLLMTMLIFSFRAKEKQQNLLSEWKYNSLSTQLPVDFTKTFNEYSEIKSKYKVYNIYKDGLKVYTAMDNTEPPLFPGCEKVNEMEKADCSNKKLYEYVAENLKYPEELKTKKIEGKVFVKFVITNNGLVAQASIQKSLHPAADKAALDLINGMNDKVGKWTPGTKEGRPVTTDMVLPISFVLNAKPESNSNDNSNSGAEAGSTSNANGEVYSFVDEMPRFPGCEDTDSSIINICAVDKMYNYIEGNIFYPKQDRENGKEGIVMAKFIVQTDGSISNARIVRGVTPSMDAEVLRMINNMNNMPQHWTPGKKDGKPVAVEFTLPVFFAF